MVKDIIKSHKRAFNYWLDGGSIIWYSHKTDKWYDGEPQWTGANCEYVMNDGFVEYRKAITEGYQVNMIEIFDGEEKITPILHADRAFSHGKRYEISGAPYGMEGHVYRVYPDAK